MSRRGAACPGLAAGTLPPKITGVGMSTARQLGLLLVATTLVVAACGGTPNESSTGPGSQSRAATTSAPSVTTEQTQSASTAPTTTATSASAPAVETYRMSFASDDGYSADVVIAIGSLGLLVESSSRIVDLASGCGVDDLDTAGLITMDVTLINTTPAADFPLEPGPLMEVSSDGARSFWPEIIGESPASTDCSGGARGSSVDAADLDFGSLAPQQAADAQYFVILPNFTAPAFPDGDPSYLPLLTWRLSCCGMGSTWTFGGIDPPVPGANEPGEAGFPGTSAGTGWLGFP